MAVELKQVREILQAEEPNYTRAARLGPEILPHLEQLILTADALLASKAAYLASQIEDEKSVELLKHAASRPEPQVRVAAAAWAGNAPAGEETLAALLVDPDEGVVKAALTAARGSKALVLQPLLQEVAASRGSSLLMGLANEALASAQSAARPDELSGAGEMIGDFPSLTAALPAPEERGAAEMKGEGVGDLTAAGTPLVSLTGAATRAVESADLKSHRRRPPRASA